MNQVRSPFLKFENRYINADEIVSQRITAVLGAVSAIMLVQYPTAPWVSLVGWSCSWYYNAKKTEKRLAIERFVKDVELQKYKDANKRKD